MKILSTLALALVAGAGLAAPVAAAEPSTAAELEARENAVWQAVKAHDYKAFEALFHPDYVGLYQDGWMSRQQEVEGALTVRVTDVQLQDVRVTRPGPDVAVVRYRAVVKGTNGTNDISGTFNAVSVWVKGKSGWLQAAHSEVKAPEAKTPEAKTP